MKNNLVKYFGVLIISFVYTLNLHAQDDARVLLQNLEEEDIKNIDALAMYPKETRTAILQASLYPEAIIKIKKIQEKTSIEFLELMEEYPQETQQQIWDLTRYPKLIQQLVDNGESNSRNIEKILKDYPKVIHTRAKTCVRKYFPILKKINNLEQVSQSAFEKIIEPYDELTQASLRSLVELPEVMTVLTENIEVTLMVGDAYKNYPEWVVHQADSLHLELARENTKELEDWKKRIEENPTVAEELQASAEDFAKENNFDDIYYDVDDYTEYEDDLYYEEEPEKTVIEKHYYHHYPYWYGYPRWYEYPRWRPYPYWFDWGFHYRPGRNIVVINLPSFYFVDWYFYRPKHHYHYPHLSAHFVNHYYGHRRSTGSITSSVRTWRAQNKAVVSDDMIVNAPRRVQAYKELGKMEQARLNHNKSNPKGELTQKQYVEKNKRSYPTLEKEIRRNNEFTSKGKTNVIPKKQNSTRRYQFPTSPKTEAKKRNEVKKIPKVSPKPKEQNKVRSVPKVVPKKTNKKARELHQKVWERSRKKNTPRIKVNPNNQKTNILKQKNIKVPTKKRSGRN